MKELLIYDDIREEGREEGLQEGLQEGREEGLQEGRVNAYCEMISEGILTVSEVSKRLNMSEKDIEELIKKGNS